MHKFHERLSGLKDASGLTQARIASELEITPQALSYYLKGREPSYDLLVAMARYFGCSTDFLLGATDSKTPTYSAQLHEHSEQIIQSVTALRNTLAHNGDVNLDNLDAITGLLTAMLGTNTFISALLFLEKYVSYKPKKETSDVSDWMNATGTIEYSTYLESLLLSFLNQTSLTAMQLRQDQIVREDKNAT